MKRKIKSLPAVLAEKGITEGYVVVNAARWEAGQQSNGGFPTKYNPPAYNRGNVPGGYLWPTRALAETAARSRIAEHPGTAWVIFKAAAVVEAAPAPIQITEIDR